MADPYQRHQMALLKEIDDVHALITLQDQAGTRDERLRLAIELKCHAELLNSLLLGMYKRIFEEEGGTYGNVQTFSRPS